MSGPESSPDRSLWGPTLAWMAGLVAVYFVTGRIGLSFARVAGSVTLIWAPAGISLAALLLVDCQMPGLDGYETARRIREAEKEGDHLPIVALTAHAIEGDREKCLAAGMDDYLSEPYRPEQLEEVLDRWLPETGA